MKLTKELEQMYEKAYEAYLNSYSPYSKFKVGACLLMKNGEYIIGTNIENASYGLTNCAERSALFAAYSRGYRRLDIDKIMIIGNTEEPVSPCGACRQVISELFDKDVPLYFYSNTGEFQKYTVSELCPYPFDEDDLK